MEKTPKEKAKELVDKFLPHAGYKYDFDTDRELRDFHSKKCALIAADEVINAISLGILQTEYWLEVKQEINNL